MTLDDLNALARDFYGPERLSAACIGPDESCFRRAIEPVSSALAAA